MNKKRLKNPKKTMKGLVKIASTYKEVNIMYSDEEREKQRSLLRKQTTVSEIIESLELK